MSEACLAGALASCVFDANPLQSRTTDAALAGAHRIQALECDDMGDVARSSTTWLTSWPEMLVLLESTTWPFLGVCACALLLEDPTAPTLVTSVTASLDTPEDIKAPRCLPENRESPEVVGTRAFVVNYNSGLIVYDVANPATSTPIIATFTNANVQQMRRIAISGNTAYITGSDGHYLAAVDLNTGTYLGRSLDLHFHLCSAED